METEDNDHSGFATTEEFVRLLARAQYGLHAFVTTLIPNRSDADDLLQDVSLVLWKKFDQFDRDCDFLKWACGIAYREALKHRRTAARKKQWLSEAVMDQLAQEAAVDPVWLNPTDVRHEALEHCLEKLGPRERGVIDQRYRLGRSVVEMAESESRPVSTVYKQLAKCRALLSDCVRAQMAQQMHPG